MCLELRSHFFFTEVTKEKKDVTGSLTENIFCTTSFVDFLPYSAEKHVPHSLQWLFTLVFILSFIQ